MTRRMPGRIHKPNAGHHFRFTFDQPEILPVGEDRLNAGAERLARLGQLLHAPRFGPPTVLGGTNDQFSVGIVGGVSAFLHQAEDVVGMEVRDQHGADLGGIDPGALQIIGQADRGRLPLTDAGAGIDHDQPIADLQHNDGQGNRHIVGGHAGLRQRGLGLVDAGVLDEGGVVRFLPNAVI